MNRLWTGKQLSAALIRPSPVKPADGNLVMDRAEMTQTAPTMPTETVVVPTADQLQALMREAMIEVRDRLPEGPERESLTKDIERSVAGLVDMGETGWAVMRAHYHIVAKAAAPAVATDGDSFAPLMRDPMVSVTSLDGEVKEPLVCLTVPERDTILAALSRPAPVAMLEEAEQALQTALGHEIDDFLSTPTPEPAAPDAAGDFTRDEMRDLVSDEDIRALLSLTDVGSGRSKLREVLNAALRARSSEPGGAVSPGGWLIREEEGGWLWTGTRIAAVAALTEGHEVVALSALATTPQPGASK